MNGGAVDATIASWLADTRHFIVAITMCDAVGTLLLARHSAVHAEQLPVPPSYNLFCF